MALQNSGILGKKAETTKNKANGEFKPFKISQKILAPKKMIELDDKILKKEVKPVDVKQDLLLKPSLKLRATANKSADVQDEKLLS